MLDLAADRWLTLRKRGGLTAFVENGDAKTRKVSFQDNPQRKLSQMQVNECSRFFEFTTVMSQPNKQQNGKTLIKMLK